MSKYKNYNREQTDCCDSDFRETGKIEALKTRHSKQLETMMVEKVLIEWEIFD